MNEYTLSALTTLSLSNNNDKFHVLGKVERWSKTYINYFEGNIMETPVCLAESQSAMS